MFAFLTIALLSALCTLALLHRLAVRYGWHLTTLALGFVGVIALTGQGV